MNNLTSALQQLENKIKTYDISATVYYDVVGTYGGTTPYPLYEIEIKSLIQNVDDIFKQATLQLNYHASATYDKFTVSGFNQRYDKDRELRELIEEWGEEVSQSELSIGAVTRISSTIDSLDRGEIGTGHKGFRIFVEFDLNYRDN